MSRNRKAVSQMQAILIAVVVVAVVAAGAYYFMIQGTPTPSPTPSPTPTPTPSNQKRVLRSTWPLPFYIDPSVGTDGASSTAEFNMYDSLVRIDFDGKVVPSLATKWTYSSDGLVWTFSLNKDVKFHDGTVMTADDVVWSMKRFLTLGTGRAYVLVPFVQDVVAVNSTAVKFTLKSAFGPFISALPTFYVLNSDLVMQHLKAGGQYGTFGDYGKEWLTTHDAGSGAYLVKDFNPAAKLVMQKHATYFKGFNAKSPDYVEMIGTTEAMTVRTMIANGELELTDNWQTKENLQAIKQLPGVTIAASMDISGGWYLMMNTKKAPTDDVHIRRALAYVFDYQKLTTTLFPDTVQMRGPVNSQLLGFDSGVFQFTRDLVKAKAELALSKYAANYTKYTITLHWCAEVPDEEKGALLFSTNAAEIGLNVQVVKTPWTSMVQEASSLETKPNIMYVSASGDYPEAGSILMNRYHSKQALTWWQNEALLNTTLDAEMENALKIVNFDQRMGAYKQIQREIVNMCPSIFMYQGISYRAFPNYVTVPYVKFGQFQLDGSLGKVYSYKGSSGMEYRLFEIDKLITYAG